VPLPTLAQAILAGLPRVAGSPWVLPSRVNGGPIVGLRKFFAGLTAAAGLAGVTPHTLRHSLASVAVQGGGSIYLLKGALGHSNVATTERYSHLAVDPIRAVVEAASAQIGAALAAGRTKASDGTPAEVLALRRRAGS
jgi:integrase